LSLNLVALAAPVQVAPASIPPIAEAVATTAVEHIESPRSTLSWEVLASMTEQHGGGLVGEFDGDSSSGDSSGDPNNDSNRGDELPAADSLADLILEQVLDWLDD
jgi:hypothetical protein